MTGMAPEHCENLYEQIADQPFVSEGIRPGGIRLTRRGLALARLVQDDVALDIGCGNGVTVEFLVHEHSIRAMGIDSSSALVSQGRAKNPALSLLVGDAEALPFADESFEAVLLECVLSLVTDRPRVFRECHRILKPFGGIIVTDIYARNPAAVPELKNLSTHSCLRGALDKNQLFYESSTAGFGNACFEDHSELLRDFAVQMIWAYESLDPFWHRLASCNADCSEVRRAVRQTRPGDFLFVGSKAVEKSESYEVS